MLLSMKAKSRAHFLRRKLIDLLQNLLRFAMRTLEMKGSGIFKTL